MTKCRSSFYPQVAVGVKAETRGRNDGDEGHDEPAPEGLIPACGTLDGPDVGDVMKSMYSSEWFETSATTVAASIMDADLDGITAPLPLNQFRRLLDVGCGVGGIYAVRR
jgi:hypothetical protein